MSACEMMSSATLAHAACGSKPWATTLRDYAESPSPARSRKSTSDSDSQGASPPTRPRQNISSVTQDTRSSWLARKDKALKKREGNVQLGTKSDTVLHGRRLANQRLSPSSKSAGNMSKTCEIIPRSSRPNAVQKIPCNTASLETEIRKLERRPKNTVNL